LKDGRRVGVEFKRVDVPTLTPSMRIATQDPGLDALYVVYPGTRRYALAQGVQALPSAALLSAISASGAPNQLALTRSGLGLGSVKHRAIEVPVRVRA
jgi:hypothetical protein